MAFWLAESKIREQRLSGVKPECRGLFVEENAQVEPKAVDALNLIGVPVKHAVEPKELERSDLEDCFLCLCMTQEHKAIVKSKFGFNATTIAEAADYVDVFDPYGNTIQAYVKVAKQLDTALEQIFERYFLEDKK